MQEVRLTPLAKVSTPFLQDETQILTLAMVAKEWGTTPSKLLELSGPLAYQIDLAVAVIYWKWKESQPKPEPLEY